MMKKPIINQAEKFVKPVPHPVVLRLTVILLCLLAFSSGYFYVRMEAEQKKYARLEDMYVRIRSQLGREETQRLIDLSRQ